MSVKKLKILKQYLKSFKNLIISIISLIQGIFTYKKTGKTPEKSYFSLLNLYCLTNGYSYAFLGCLLKLYRTPYILPHKNGVLGDLDANKINKIIQSINKDGYYVFEQLLPNDICEKITSLATTQECSLRGALDPTLKLSIYDRDNPIAVTYWLEEEYLITNPDIQMLMADLSILAIAQAYLETQPVLDIVTMWWSTAFFKEACSKSAQLYHFDMDRIKWLKFFIYLTDVTTDNGPHCYVVGSHQLGSKPKELLERGYVRIPDKDIEKFYSKEDLIEVVAPRGTIIAGDTLCFHKGKPVTVGDRLILEIEFANSLFGASYQVNYIDKIHHPNLSKISQIYSRIYSKFIFKQNQ